MPFPTTGRASRSVWTAQFAASASPAIRFTAASRWGWHGCARYRTGASCLTTAISPRRSTRPLPRACAAAFRISSPCGAAGRGTGPARGRGDRWRLGYLCQLPAAPSAQPLAAGARTSAVSYLWSIQTSVRDIDLDGRRDRHPDPAGAQGAAATALRSRESADLFRASLRSAPVHAVGGVRAFGLAAAARSGGTGGLCLAHHRSWPVRDGLFLPRRRRASPVEEIRGFSPRSPRSGRCRRCARSSTPRYPACRCATPPTPPPQLRVLPGFVYFELDRGVPDWREFQQATALGLHVAVTGRS